MWVLINYFQGPNAWNLSFFFLFFIMKKIILIFIIVFIPTLSFANQDIINLINTKLSELGEFQKPKNYPKGFEEKHMTGCISWKCISDKSATEMGKIFKRSDSYNQRNPGNQIYGMAYFEIFYQNKLKKNQSSLKKFKSEWPEKIVKGKKIASLIKTNESRKTMRASLGIDIKASPEEAINIYWTLADFLQKGNVEKVKVDKSLKKRQRIISDFKNSLGQLKRKIEKQDFLRIIKYLEG